MDADDGGLATRAGSRPIGSTTASIEFDAGEQHRRGARGRRARRATVMVAALVVTLAAFGLAGPRQAVVSGSSGDYDVRLAHPSITRGGMPARWSVEIQRSDGRAIGGRVDVATTGAYFEQFDFQGLFPEPDTVVSTSELLTWSFEPAGEPSMLIVLDVRVQPNARWRYRGSTIVHVDGVPVATLDYSTTVLP